MTTLYTSQTISGYNSSPPADDGSQVASNQVDWSKHKTKLGDPIKTLAEGINTQAAALAGYILHSTTTSITTTTTLTAADRGKTYITTNSITINLPAAATAENNYLVTVINGDGGTVTIDPNGSETINGETTKTITTQYTASLLYCDGSEWYLLPFGEVTTADNTFSGDNSFTGQVTFPDAGELTIATGAITPTGVRHTIDTESGAASDDLDTISGGADGDIIIVSAEHTDRTVVLKDGTGNIQTQSGGDITLDNTEKVAMLIYDGALSAWVVISQPPASLVVLQEAYGEKTSSQTITSANTIPLDSSIPQNTEGSEILTLAVTPVSASSNLIIDVEVTYEGVSNNPDFVAALFVDSTADAIAATAQETGLAGNPFALRFRCKVASGSTSARTYKLRGGPATSSSNVKINPYFGGVQTTSIRVTEVV